MTCIEGGDPGETNMVGHFLDPSLFHVPEDLAKKGLTGWPREHTLDEPLFISSLSHPRRFAMQTVAEMADRIKRKIF